MNVLVGVMCAVVTLLAACAGCTKDNPKVCCLNAADCAAVGLPPITTCDPGQGCSENACVKATCIEDSDCTEAGKPHCSAGLCRECEESRDCAAPTSVCEPLGLSCQGCTADEQCAELTATPLCRTDGACVQCKSNLDCPNPDAPACSAAGSCRECRFDRECASGGCDANGRCVVEAMTVYVAPTGTDTGDCSRAMPCRTPLFASTKLTAARNHLVFAPGQYTGLLGKNTGVASLSYHGNDATLMVNTVNPDAVILAAGNRLFLRDLAIVNTAASTLTKCTSSGEIVLEHVKTTGAFEALSSTCTIRYLNSELPNVRVRGESRSTITMRGTRGLNVVADNSRVDIENSSFFGASDHVITAQNNSSGTVAFVTMAKTARGHSGALCIQSPLVVTNTIIWNPNDTVTAAIDGNCMVTGANHFGPNDPMTPGATDPKFVNLDGGDLHLTEDSPVVDRADSGPKQDADGNPRPARAKFDLGAYELQ